jgi:hypothetical protein
MACSLPNSNAFFNMAISATARPNPLANALENPFTASPVFCNWLFVSSNPFLSLVVSAPISAHKLAIFFPMVHLPF